MITASLGLVGSETGPTYYYNDSDTDQLMEIICDPEPTTSYVNTLPGVDATPEEIQQVAAAGIVRLSICESGFGFMSKAKTIMLDACRKGYGTAPLDDSGNKLGGSLFNALLDSASVIATRKNNAAETAGLIETEIKAGEDVFVIALANGGIISAAHTFLQLSEGDHELSFVRYSRHKSQDKEPKMNPYPDSRKELLKQAAEGRRVVVCDEDYATGETLRTAVDYFAAFFDKEVLGIAPVQATQHISYKPIVIRSRDYRR